MRKLTAGAVAIGVAALVVGCSGAGGAKPDDAGDLVEQVGSSSWPSTGTPLDPQIFAVQDDCANC